VCLACKAYIDFPFDVCPFLGGAESLHELLEASRVGRGEFEPRQEVEGLCEVAPMMQTPGDGWQVLESGGDVV
jgi:hypothetical protein